jgi:transposase
MTTRPRRIEVITGPERRRRWSVDQKLAIVAESLRPGASPTAVARKHGLSTGQLYTWRGRYARRAASGFTRVELVDGHLRAEPAARPAGLIEIVLPDGVIVRAEASVSEKFLRRVLSAVRG